MGWSFGWSRRAELVHERTTGWQNERGSRRCVAHCYRGNPHKGVLWTVWSVLDAEGNEKDRYIGCDLLEYLRSQGPGHEWGYKDMCESSHPYYYSCPLKYLEMAPVACEVWREKVREYHVKHNKKLEKGKLYHTAPGIKIKGHKIDFILVESLKPMRGVASTQEGLVWGDVRFKKAHVTELVAPAPSDR